MKSDRRTSATLPPASCREPKLKEGSEHQTLAVGEDRHAVDVVGVAVVHLYTLSRHQPPSDARVVAAREELCAADDGESSHAVLVTYSRVASVNRAAMTTEGPLPPTCKRPVAVARPPELDGLICGAREHEALLREDEHSPHCSRVTLRPEQTSVSTRPPSPPQKAFPYKPPRSSCTSR